MRELNEDLNIVINKETLIEMGGKLWEKNGMERVYINAATFNELFGTKLSDKTNKFFFDCETNAMMRSYKGKAPQIEAQFSNEVESGDETDVTAEDVKLDIFESLEIRGADKDEFGNYEVQVGILSKGRTIYVTINADGECGIDTVEVDDNSRLLAEIEKFAEESGVDDANYHADAIAIEIIKEIENRTELFIKAKGFDADLKAIGISQEEFCGRVGVTRQGVSKWKRTGKYPSWVSYSLIGIATVLQQDQGE